MLLERAMPIILPSGLPAATELEAEGYDVLRFETEVGSERPIRIGLLNLMPTKPATEAQFARLLSESTSAVELELIRPATHNVRQGSSDHLDRFYRTWGEVGHTLDAFIVTGAPVETLAFEDVDYWAELAGIIDDARQNLTASLYVCWSAQATLYRLHGIQKQILPEKAFGVFEQTVLERRSSLVRGLGESFPVPVSRHTASDRASIEADQNLVILASSSATGPCIIEDAHNRATFVFDHLEYGAGTLRKEYERDKAARPGMAPPKNYVPEDDAAAEPLNTWRPYASLFYRNWVERVAARVSQRDDPSLKWLFFRSAAEGVLPPRLLLFATISPGLLVDVIQRLAGLGLTANAARIKRQMERYAVVEVALTAADTPKTEAAARALLGIPGSRRAYYRLPNGSGGLLTANPAGSANVLRLGEAA
jgi:homoserine O-succinyltransferase